LSTVVYDTLEQHLQRHADLAQAAVPMGMLLAWAANQHLLAAQVAQLHERLLLRIRFQEALGSELLVACGGDLHSDLFNLDGQAFLQDYYADYLGDYKELFGEEYYRIADDIDNYQRVAAMLTHRFMHSLGRKRVTRVPGLPTRVRGWWRRLWQ